MELFKQAWLISCYVVIYFSYVLEGCRMLRHPGVLDSWHMKLLLHQDIPMALISVRDSINPRAIE